MRRPALLLLAVLSGPLLTAQPPSRTPELKPVPLHGLDPSLRDTTVDPCVNFFQYACGTWLKDNPIPADRSSYGVDTQLTDNNELVLEAILEHAAIDDAHRDPDTQKIGDDYATCMNPAGSGASGLGALQPMLDRINAVDRRAALAPVVAELQRAGARALFDFDAEEDYKDARRMIATATQPRLSLPEKGYYLRTDAKSVRLRQQFTEHVARMFTLAGEPAGQAQADAGRVLALETRLANGSLSPEQMRDPARLYHLTPLPQFRRQISSFDFDVYLRQVGAPGFSSLNVATPGYFESLNALLAGADLPSLRALLRWNLLNGTPSTALPAPLDDEQFAFYGRILRGQPQQQPRWKRCVATVDGALGEALGRVYVAQVFTPADKARNTTILDNIEAAMGRDIRGLDWMSPETRARAELKLGKVTNKVGYPDHWRDYSSLVIRRGDAIGNAQRAAAFESHRILSKIGTPTDKLEWEMSPPTVNAYYDPQANTVNLPAGILQPPYYDARMGDAVNYGQGGGLEGHELTHGFDDEGRQFDGDGNFSDWWTPQDEARFKQRADCVVAEYGSFVAVDDLHVNGRLTLGENIADIGGVRLGYLAWKHLAEKPEPDVGGLTPDQQFFTAYAQSWCSHSRAETMRVRVQADPHSPEEYRVNGVVRNLPEFQKAFGCRTGQPMAPAERCSIW